MAQYIAYIRGQRNPVSRLGHKTTGLEVTLSGWDIGIRAVARYDQETKKDVIEIYRTRGSSGGAGQEALISITEE